jgi:hypothetical protein
VYERREDAGAARADRVPERDRPPVDVHLRLVDTEHAHRVERHRGERLVDLEELDVIDAQAGLLERGGRGVRGRARQVREVVGHRRLGDDPSERPAPVRLRPLVGGEDQRAGAVVHARGVAGGVGPLLVERPLEARQPLERRVSPRSLVDVDRRLALLRLDRHRDDLLGEPPVVDGLDRQLV